MEALIQLATLAAVAMVLAVGAVIVWTLWKGPEDVGNGGADQRHLGIGPVERSLPGGEDAPVARGGHTTTNAGC